jgi:hypothetical protein
MSVLPRRWTVVEAITLANGATDVRIGATGATRNGRDNDDTARRNILLVMMRRDCVGSILSCAYI